MNYEPFPWVVWPFLTWRSSIVDHSTGSFYVHRTSNLAFETFSTVSPEVNKTPFFASNADFNRISSVWAKSSNWQHINGFKFMATFLSSIPPAYLLKLPALRLILWVEAFHLSGSMNFFLWPHFIDITYLFHYPATCCGSGGTHWVALLTGGAGQPAFRPQLLEASRSRAGARISSGAGVRVTPLDGAELCVAE